MEKYGWLRDMLHGKTDEELESFLPAMLYDIYLECGVDILLSLLEHLPKIRIYVSPRNLADDVRPQDLCTLSKRKAEKSMSAGMFFIYKHCGAKTLQALLEHFPGIMIYVGPGMLNQARGEYIQRAWTGNNAKEIAITLGVSEQYVYEMMQKQARQTKIQFVHITPRLPF